MKLLNSLHRRTPDNAALPGGARGVECQLERIRWGVWLVMGLLAVLWLVYASRSHDLAQEAQRTKAKIAAA